MSIFDVMPVTTTVLIVAAVWLTISRYLWNSHLTEAQFAIKFWWVYLLWFALGAAELLLRAAWNRVRRK